MTKARIIIVEDEGVLAMHLGRILTSWGHVVTAVAATAEQAIRSVSANPPDLVLMDIGLRGDMDGIEAAQAILEGIQVPVVYLTSFADDSTIERARATSPYGYVLKPVNERELKITVDLALDRNRADQVRQQAEARLAYMAHHDALTGLPNRVLFHERLQQATASARRNGKLVAVLLLDLDNFKSVNDTLGHATGDSLLVAAAARIRGCVRETDTVARLGGDEIAIIQTNLDDPDGATTLADKLVHVFDQSFLIDGIEVRTTVSIGTTVVPLDEEDPEESLRYADNAMYRAKEAGRNSFNTSTVHGAAPGKSPETPERALRHALEKSEFEMHFQPVFDVVQHRVISAEALVRWNHPEKGLIPASQFIQTAERIGIITKMVDVALWEACTAACEWLVASSEIRVSINLSDTDLYRRDLADAISSVLQALSMAPERLELEVSERFTVNRQRPLAVANLERFRDLGVPISLDHFGREYASMLTIRALPIRKVKIDRSLISMIPDDSHVKEIVRAILDVSRSCDVEVVGVGVETEDQLEWLRTAGCHQAQGNLLGVPLSAADFLRVHVA